MSSRPSPYARIDGKFQGSILKPYRLRWKRRRFLYRAWRKRNEIKCVRDLTQKIKRGDILCFATVRNEALRLPFFLQYYRALGVRHFLIVDNASTDSTGSYLAKQNDISVWSTRHGYRMSRFGVDWLAQLQFRFGHGHWCLTVDADELLVYPACEARPLQELTKDLERRKQWALGTLMLDLFPKGPVADQDYNVGQNPLEVIPWFDPTGYQVKSHKTYGNAWIQGGVRKRMFFQSEPDRAPTLNKFPLVKWNRRFAYVNSTHQILPVRLHQHYDPASGRNTSGALLHTKFLPDIVERSMEEQARKEHFQNSDLYEEYYSALIRNPDLWDKSAQKYENSDQLVELGLISRGV